MIVVLFKNIYLFFRTFTEAKYTAHPKLNLIIGPNGSGKSSIVTALILGFGGGPKDINRGDRVITTLKLKYKLKYYFYLMHQKFYLHIFLLN